MDNPPNLAPGVARWIEATIAERGISVNQLSIGARIPRTTLIYQLDNIRDFNLAQLQRIAEYLGVSVSDILSYAERAA